jgi:hypothetical protein
MDQSGVGDSRSTWPYWLGVALLVIGGVAPLAFGLAPNSRMGVVIVPFGLGAAGFALNALWRQPSRIGAAVVYFAAGLAVVYGILLVLGVPLRLAVVGTCSGAVAQCSAGFEAPLSSGENNSLTAVTTLGALAILCGFVGLWMVYRRLAPPRTRRAATQWPARPPAEQVNPATSPPPAPAPVAAEQAVAAKPAKATAAAELPELPELEAPHEEPMLELPAPADETSLETEPGPPPS